MVTILLQKILDLLKAKLGLINTMPETASGATVVFDTDKELPLDVLKATISPSQESGTPTPADPKAITCYDSVVITQKDGTDTTIKEITIALGRLVCGGVLDVINGTLTITHVKETFKWSEGGAVADLGTYTRKMFISSTMANESLVQLCNVAPYAYNYSTDTLHFYCRAYTNDTRIYLFLDEDNLPADFDEFEVVYGLATPIVISGLTPANITTINGTNKLSANCGDLEVEYRVSTQSIISYKDLTSDLTIDYQTIQESSCDVKAYQQGNIVIVEINFMRYLTMPEEKAVIITGLPKPVAATCGAVLDTYDSANGIRLRVNTDGELQQWYNRPAGNHEAVGQIVYITDEV